MKYLYHLNHKKLYLTIILTTGFCSLGYQVIWQRYLSVLVGSHARSSAIVISVFLLGLALGYYAFGRVSERIKDRYLLLKIYGFVELFTGLYAVLFPSLFQFFLNSPISQTNHFGIHLLLAGILLIPATFLMGATVPVMTTVLPESKENVNLIHSRIYGLNTLGAFLGVIVAGLYLIPKMGYETSLIFLGGLNILVSLFYIKNRLSGPSYEKEKPEVVTHPFNEKALYALGFVAGLTSLSLEILWFRVLGLTVGNSFLVFPFILSIFVLMIGLGSLTLKKLDLRAFQNTVAYSLLFSFVAFLSVPYLPLAISHLRVSFAEHQLAFYLYHGLLYLCLLALLSPSIFFLGRLLPFVYSMIQKNQKDYGLKVGYLYFLNTVGTFFGAIALGYLAFHVFNLKAIYLLTLGLLFAMGIYFLRSRWILQGLIMSLVVASVFLPFSRKHHEIGLFRNRDLVLDTHFKGFIEPTNKPHEGKKVIYFKDGPNSTVAVIGHEDAGSKSVLVNGKSDGHSKGDYGTTSLISLIPYLITSGNELKSMVIGLGTGISAGTLTSLERVSEVDLVEISDAVIESAEFMSPENSDFHKSPKTTIYQSDAFQQLKSVNKQYDMIISEPPNPWVIGVENLYTPYFYNLALTRLTQRGIFVQWIHTYSMSSHILTTILSNLKKTFKNITILQTGHGDIAFFSSNRPEPFWIDARHVISPELRRPAVVPPIMNPEILEAELSPSAIEPTVREVLGKLHVERISDLNFYRIYNSLEVDAIVASNPSFTHELFYPKLNRESYTYFYSGSQIPPENLLAPMYRRLLKEPVKGEWQKKTIGEDCK